MLNNRVPIIIVSVIIVISMVIGGVLLFIDRDEPIDPIDPSITDAPIDDNFGVTLDPSTGNYVIEFDEGNEVFLDTSLIAYLERMEQGVPDIDENGNYYLYNDGDLVYDESQEKDLEGVLDNIILLINHFAKREYSMDASHQIQRFYVEYYDRFVGVSFEEMANKMAECFPRGGADPGELNDKVIEVFGFNRGDECAFVFSPLTLAEVKVEFYNVMPLEVEVTDEIESLCIYDSWYNEEDDGYERNLEAWLHNVIKVSHEANLSEEKIIVAQIVYAGSVADADYRSDWADALVKCLSIEDWSYDNLKLAVEAEFGVCLDNNVPIQEYFEVLDAEVIE